MDERTIQIDCGSIHARLWGPADPVETVVLLHGGPGISERYMEPIVPFVDNGRRRIVSYDQRGTGLSICDSDDEADYSLDAHAADLTRVLDAVAVGPVHLLGHSWGGVVAMDYAARHADRVASIITIGSAPPNHVAIGIASKSMGERVAALQERGLIPKDLPEDASEIVQAILPMYLWDPTRAVPPEAVAALQITEKAHQLTSRVLETLDLTDALSSYRGRALVIFGVADPIGLPASEVTRDALANSQLRYEIIERCGHMPWLEAPDRFRALLEAWLGG